jgi:hypothetical protein
MPPGRADFAATARSARSRGFACECLDETAGVDDGNRTASRIARVPPTSRGHSNYCTPWAQGGVGGVHLGLYRRRAVWWAGSSPSAVDRPTDHGSRTAPMPSEGAPPAAGSTGVEAARRDSARRRQLEPSAGEPPRADLQRIGQRRSGRARGAPGEDLGRAGPSLSHDAPMVSFRTMCTNNSRLLLISVSVLLLEHGRCMAIARPKCRRRRDQRRRRSSTSRVPTSRSGVHRPNLPARLIQAARSSATPTCIPLSRSMP